MIPGIVASIIKLINVNNTVLQLKMNGVTGSNVFIDTSPTNKQIITYGDAIIVNNNFGSRLYLDGSNCALRVGSHADFSFGSGDFTIRARFTLVGGQPYARLIHFGNYWHSPDAYGILAKDASYPGKLTFASYKLGQSRLLVSITTIVVGQEYHVEVNRKNGIFRLFINGVLESMNDLYVGVSIESSNNNTVAVGSAYAPNVEEQFHGYVDDVEIIKGIGLHESSFTPTYLP